MHSDTKGAIGFAILLCILRLMKLWFLIDVSADYQVVDAYPEHRPTGSSKRDFANVGVVLQDFFAVLRGWKGKSFHKKHLVAKINPVVKHLDIAHTGRFCSRKMEPSAGIEPTPHRITNPVGHHWPARQFPLLCLGRRGRNANNKS